MEQRMDYTKVSPKAYAAMLHLENTVRNSGIDHSLLHLIKVRASQINQCAFCIDMHWKDARVDGETEQRLYGLSAWRESPYYSERERAALALTESVTLLSETHVPDDVYSQAKTQFSDEELASLVFAIIAINGWNRIAVTFRSKAGEYQPAAPKKVAV